VVRHPTRSCPWLPTYPQERKFANIHPLRLKSNKRINKKRGKRLATHPYVAYLQVEQKFSTWIQELQKRFLLHLEGSQLRISKFREQGGSLSSFTHDNHASPTSDRQLRNHETSLAENIGRTYDKHEEESGWLHRAVCICHSILTSRSEK